MLVQCSRFPPRLDTDMSYLSLFHWSFSSGASELVCTVVILFALLLAPVRMESITVTKMS